MTKTAYINARVIDPESGFDEVCALVTENGAITDFGKIPVPGGAETVDCKGMALVPGLLDIQVHAREPGQEKKETLETMSRSAVAGGVTTIACMANTTPPVDNVASVEFIKRRAAETALCRVYPYAAITRGIKGEELTDMISLAEAGAIGFSDDGLPVMNSLVMRHAFEYALQVDAVISQHAEDLALTAGASMNEGEVSARLGLRGAPGAAEAIIVERDIQLLRLVKKKHGRAPRYHVLHISTIEALEAVARAKDMGLPVTCEVAPHHFALTHEEVGEYRTFAKMNPPLRAEEDRAAMVRGLKDGTIDAIATDHAPHDQETKRVPFKSAAYGIVGLETMLPLSLELYHRGELSLRDVLGKMTFRAADIIGVPAGRIKKGAIADLTLIDLTREWEVEPEAFCSKSKNSPLENRKVKGRAVMTVVGGRRVFAL